MHSNQLDLAITVEQIARSEHHAPTWRLGDRDVWKTVFELIAQTNPTTPPTAFEKAVFVELIVGFYEGCFEGKAWTNNQSPIFDCRYHTSANLKLRKG
jgi:hypothetical protein